MPQPKKTQHTVQTIIASSTVTHSLQTNRVTMFPRVDLYTTGRTNEVYHALRRFGRRVTIIVHTNPNVTTDRDSLNCFGERVKITKASVCFAKSLAASSEFPNTLGTHCGVTKPLRLLYRHEPYESIHSTHDRFSSTPKPYQPVHRSTNAPFLSPT